MIVEHCEERETLHHAIIKKTEKGKSGIEPEITVENFLTILL